MSNAVPPRLIIELHLADHVPAARAKELQRVTAEYRAVAWPAGSTEAVIAALLAVRLDGSVVDRARQLLDASPRPLVIAVTAAVGPAQADLIDALLCLGVWNIVVNEDSQTLIESIVSCAERMQHVEAVMASDMLKNNLVGTSNAWRALIREVIWSAKFSSASILLLGETGTGKDLLARLIHTLDGRTGKGDLIVVDCTTLTSELAGSELFGHERGAFTGAHAQRAGAAQLANGGTLFLDEVGELHPAVQAQLLRLLQEGTYKSVGGSTWHRATFRLVCATHRDLTEAVADGRFRQDLYFRIAGWVSRVPPLRDRPEDIPLLANRFLVEFGCGQQIDKLVEHVLAHHSFPGNVRELRQLMMQTAVKHCGASPVSIGDLPTSWHKRQGEKPMIEANRDAASAAIIADQCIRDWVRAGIGLRDISQRAGDIAIREALAVEGNHVGRAARRLGITERAIQLRKAQRSSQSPGAQGSQ